MQKVEVIISNESRWYIESKTQTNDVVQTARYLSEIADQLPVIEKRSKQSNEMIAALINCKRTLKAMAKGELELWMVNDCIDEIEKLGV